MGFVHFERWVDADNFSILVGELDCFTDRFVSVLYSKTIPPGVIFPSICPVVRSVTRPICGVAFSLIIVLLVVFKGLDYGGKSTHKESCPVEKTIDGLIDYWFKTRYLRLYTDFPALRLVLFSHK